MTSRRGGGKVKGADFAPLQRHCEAPEEPRQSDLKPRLLRRFASRNDGMGVATKGFTFVEILITLSILMISVVPLMQMYQMALGQVAYMDDMRTALDLAREEVEKIKNLALTEKQIKQLGNLISPPVRLNRRVWYTVRVVDQAASPLEVQVTVYRDQPGGSPLVSLVAIINK